MLQTLTDSGRAEVASELVNQGTFPGWGYMLEHGATTLWEHWEFSDNTYSHNHPMFGSVSEWFYRALAGINAASDAAGFDRIILRPQPVGDLKWVNASYESVRGKVVSDWRAEAGQFKLHLQIPVGAVATVFLPARDGREITEGGKPIGRSPGVRFLRREDGSVVVAVASGEYDFTCARR